MTDRLATKHEPRHCTTCRDFLKHDLPQLQTRGGSQIPVTSAGHLIDSSSKSVSP
jgi:hypothetical protein